MNNIKSLLIDFIEDVIAEIYALPEVVDYSYAILDDDVGTIIFRFKTENFGYLEIPLHIVSGKLNVADAPADIIETMRYFAVLYAHVTYTKDKSYDYIPRLTELEIENASLKAQLKTLKETTNDKA